MPKLSAGILVYRLKGAGFEVFLVHPGGPFWAKKDKGAWSLPKGEYAEDEDPWEAANREFGEEVGRPVPEGQPTELGQVKYSNKLLTAWAIPGNINEQALKSNVFELEWPPRSGHSQQFPEVDKAAWFDVATAKEKLVPAQAVFVERLVEKLGVTSGRQTGQLSLL